MDHNKYKEKYILSTESERWKTISNETPLHLVEWDEDLEKFLCKTEEDEYHCSWEEFYDKHIVSKAKKTEYFDSINVDTESDDFRFASWTCLINGFIMFISNHEDEIPIDKDIHVNSKHLTDYIYNRSDDLMNNLNNGVTPEWLVPDLFKMVSPRTKEFEMV